MANSDKTPTVYIETTIASAYHETRADPETVARRQWTRRWWDGYSADYRVVTSEAAVAELERGEYPHQSEAIQFVSAVEFLPIVDELQSIAETYIRHQLMPKNPFGDALHLAVASFYRCDFLVTWNCRHLANANKFVQIRRINESLELFVPTLTTPLELLGEDVQS